MGEKELIQLPPDTVKLIASTQIITSISTAVKELIENSLDAEARNIQVKLDNYGFDIVEVKDDGHGVSYNNIQRMFLPACTSKITCFSDLGKLQSYGFRGEALSALAKLSKVTVTTKTSADNLAMTYNITQDGIVESSKPSHLQKGTVVTAANIFSKLPVRKQYLSGKKKASEELKKVEYVVQSLSLIHPDLRITLLHNKCLIWQKNFVKGIKQSFMQVVGLKVVSRMEHLNELGNNILVDLVIPKKKLENVDNLFTNSSQNIFIYVNRRPIMLNKLSKLVMEHIFLHYDHLNQTNKYAVSLISVEVPSQEVDVNLEPNKTKIYLKNEVEVTDLIDRMLSRYYEQNIKKQESEVDKTEMELGDEYEKDKTEVESGDEYEKDDDENDKSQKKRPRFESKECSIKVGILRDDEFSCKNDGWRLEVVSSNDFSQKKEALSLCSQINMENCTFTSNEEVGELKKQLSENSKLLITSVNVDSETRLSQRNELQCYEKLKRIDETEQIPTSSEGRILPPWPIREVPSTKSKTVDQGNMFDVVQDDRNLKRPSDKNFDFLGDVDLQDWSRGDLEIADGVLPSGVALAKPGQFSDEVLEEDVEQFDLSMRSISSQMGKKELSAFTKYARIMRPKILTEFPGMIFTKVAGMLVDRWKALPSDDKKYYEKLAKAVDIRREIHMENRKIDEFRAEKPPHIKKKSKCDGRNRERFEVKINTSIKDIIQNYKTQRPNDSDCNVQLIGQLQPNGNWLYRKGNEIGHVRHSGLQELILSQKMLSSHSVPRQVVLKAIFINESILGNEVWNILIELETVFDPMSCRYTVVSDVVSKNGFKIDLEKQQDSFSSGWITEVASMIPFYGVAELRETLMLYRKEGEFADLRRVRPTAVISYITNEVIRIVQQTPRSPDLTDMKEMIDTWQTCLSHLPAQCLHFRDIFASFYQLRQPSNAN